ACSVHGGWPPSSNSARDIPQRTQTSRLKANRWPPAVLSKVIAVPVTRPTVTAVIASFLLRWIMVEQQLRQLGDIHHRANLLPVIGWTELAFEFFQCIAKKLPILHK